MRLSEHKLIIYDSQCGFCQRSRDFAVRWGLVPENRISAYQDLGPDQIGLVDPERFKNEMAFIDQEKESVHYGSEAIVAILGEQSWLAKLNRISIFQLLLDRLYRLIAYNRLIISTPRLRAFQCVGCTPDGPAAYRIGWWALASGLGLGLILLAWHLLYQAIGPVERQSISLLFLLLPLNLFLISMVSLKNWLDFWAHLASIFLRGSLILLPLIIWIPVLNIFNGWVGLISFALAIIIMSRQYHIRRRYMQRSYGWDILGAGLLSASILGQFAVFFMNC